jgi:hypothetical protein
MAPPKNGGGAPAPAPPPAPAPDLGTTSSDDDDDAAEVEIDPAHAERLMALEQQLERGEATYDTRVEVSIGGAD